MRVHMMTMTRRERLRRCYFNEELDRPAVYSRTGFPQGDSTYDALRAYLDLRKGLIVSASASPYIPGAGERCWPQYKAMIDTVINWQT
jgi:hypothetical protein